MLCGLDLSTVTSNVQVPEMVTRQVGAHGVALVHAALEYTSESLENPPQNDCVIKTGI